MGVTELQESLLSDLTSQGLTLQDIDHYLKVGTPGLFMRHCSGGQLKLYPHIAALDNVIMAAMSGAYDIVIVEMPPRHGKSVYLSQYTPGYALGHHPDWEVMLISYQSKFAAEWGQKARDIFEEHGADLFNLWVNPRARARARWCVKGHNGVMNSTGFGGSITGKGAHFAIIDDPIKNQKEALSASLRESQKDWWQSTFINRVYPNCPIIIVQTRWHVDDLAGWLWTQHNQNPRVIRITIPAIAFSEDDIPEEERLFYLPDPMGRNPGEPLCPQLRPLNYLLRLQKDMGEYWFSANMQQRPYIREGGIFKDSYWKYWTPDTLPPKFQRIILSADCTYKKTESGSFVVFQVWGTNGADRYLLDQLRLRMDLGTTELAVKLFCGINLDRDKDAPKMKPEIIKMFREYGLMDEEWRSKPTPGFKFRWGSRATAKYFEDKGNGPAVVREMKNQIQGMITYHVEDEKETRAMAVQPQCQAGNVYLPRQDLIGYNWVYGFKAEAREFPTSAYNDQVDSMTQALTILSQAKVGEILTSERKSGLDRLIADRMFG